MVLENIPIYRFRWLLYELVKRDLKLRYRGSVLGVAWTLVNPILFMAVYTFVFSVIMKSTIEHYPLFLLSGLIPWLFLSGAIGQCATSIVDGSTYIGKTLMPAELLVLVPVLSNGVNFLITILLFIVVAAALGANIAWALAFLPLLTLIVFSATLGLSMIIAVATVYFRDVQQIVAYTLTAIFFLTPIFYSRTTVPSNLQFVVTFNPIASLVAMFQNVFYKGVPPNGNDLLLSAAFAAAVMAIAFVYFNSMRDSLGENV